MTIADNLYRFQDGKLSKCDMPAWFLKATESDDAIGWAETLSRAGCRQVESFGDIDNLNLYRTPDDGFLIEYVDVEELVVSVLIYDRADYLTFRAQYIAPLASLIMESDRQDVWDKEQANK
ncbi:hypothetical protein [Bradyrhizobium australiense]|uniref:Uncharacterized protein n=1 Tax=Bradyrhizobium australiense TaxID=2721161 RepID=A0A7Y4GTC1_9BRAD|nr:hypothetical protein [Bradyrhizobium australiense]NOJ41377.1 hypothetical protein [Bradyrhizobium australiense]